MPCQRMLLDRTFRGRRAAVLDGDELRVTVLAEGGHLAEIVHKPTALSPLWIPPWPSIEPSAYDAARHPEYGGGAEGRLLAGIMGHNLCLDLFGRPSPEEAATGMTVHGEAGVSAWDLTDTGDGLAMRARLPRAGLRVERALTLRGDAVRVDEAVENHGPEDRLVGWTQHVTLGPPFLERGRTELRASATRSMVFEGDMGAGAYLAPGAVFDWPRAPRLDGDVHDLRTLNGASAASAFTTHLMDPSAEDAWVAAFSPGAGLVFGCVWPRADFPWLGLWEEHHGRTHAPWNGRASTLGLEFGVSPFPEPREAMAARGTLFGERVGRVIPAGGRVEVTYWLVARAAAAAPAALTRPA